MIKNIEVSGEVNMIPTLRKIRGGQSKQIWGGASTETLSGVGQLKKHPVDVQIPDVRVCVVGT